MPGCAYRPGARRRARRREDRHGHEGVGRLDMRQPNNLLTGRENPF
ncbi:MAG: hypothetical protein ACXWQ5_17035 [Ktedonobacterales bacterium]